MTLKFKSYALMVLYFAFSMTFILLNEYNMSLISLVFFYASLIVIGVAYWYFHRGYEQLRAKHNKLVEKHNKLVEKYNELLKEVKK